MFLCHTSKQIHDLRPPLQRRKMDTLLFTESLLESCWETVRRKLVGKLVVVGSGRAKLCGLKAKAAEELHRRPPLFFFAALEWRSETSYADWCRNGNESDISMRNRRPESVKPP